MEVGDVVVSDETLKDVWGYLKRNRGPTSLDGNYVSAIARSTGLDRRSVSDAVQVLEEMGLVSRSRDGREVLIAVDVILDPDGQQQDGGDAESGAGFAGSELDPAPGWS